MVYFLIIMKKDWDGGRGPGRTEGTLLPNGERLKGMISQ